VNKILLQVLKKYNNANHSDGLTPLWLGLWGDAPGASSCFFLHVANIQQFNSELGQISHVMLNADLNILKMKED
jgi:hypothetical protein